MNREDFISIMQRMEFTYNKRENYLNKIEEFFGMKMVEDIYETDFFNILIDTIEASLKDNGKNITYLIYECNFSLKEMESKIEHDDGTLVILKDYGDLYDFITL